MAPTLRQLKEAFTDFFIDHHALLLEQMLNHIVGLGADIELLDSGIETDLAPFADSVGHLDEIPGSGATAAGVIIAEIGLDMSRFPTAGRLCSWAKFSPGINSCGRSVDLLAGGDVSSLSAES